MSQSTYKGKIPEPPKEPIPLIVNGDKSLLVAATIDICLFGLLLIVSVIKGIV